MLPALYFVNRECRAEVLKIIRIRRNPFSCGAWSYINPSYDIVHCPRDDNQSSGHYTWHIPGGADVPGLQTLALSISPTSPWLKIDPGRRVDPRSHCKAEAKALATQLCALPGLKEVLLVRTIPRFLRAFLFSNIFDASIKHHLHAGNSLKLEPVFSRHYTRFSSFFYTVNPIVESWILKAQKFGPKPMTGIYLPVRHDGPADDTDKFLMSLLEADSRTIMRHHKRPDVYTYTLHEKELTSQCLEDRVLTLVKAAWKELGRDEKKLPKFEVVYRDEDVAERMCHI